MPRVFQEGLLYDLYAALNFEITTYTLLCVISIIGGHRRTCKVQNTPRLELSLLVQTTCVSIDCWQSSPYFALFILSQATESTPFGK